MNMVWGRSIVLYANSDIDYLIVSFHFCHSIVKWILSAQGTDFCYNFSYTIFYTILFITIVYVFLNVNFI